VLVLGIGWLQSTYFLDHIHTSFLSFTCASYKNKSAHNGACKKKYIRCTDFAIFRPANSGRRQEKFHSAAGPLGGIWYPLLGLKGHNMVCEMVLERRARPCASPVSSLISRSQQKAAGAGKNRPSDTHLLKISDLMNSIRRGVPSPIPAAPGRAPGARSI
jgi:hypothetical protein